MKLSDFAQRKPDTPAKPTDMDQKDTEIPNTVPEIWSYPMFFTGVEANSNWNIIGPSVPWVKICFKNVGMAI